MSSGLVESNTSHTVSARRNSAAGVVAAKENIKRRPSLSRRALTEAALSPAFISAGGSGGAARSILGGAGGGATGVSLAAGAGFGISAAADGGGAASGLISIWASLANFSEVTGGTGAISLGCCDITGAVVPGAAATGAPDTVAFAAAAAGEAGAAACAASAAASSAGGFSACWKATSTM